MYPNFIFFVPGYFSTFKSTQKQNLKELKIPTHNLTQRQKYFLVLVANLFKCSVYSAEDVS